MLMFGQTVGHSDTHYFPATFSNWDSLPFGIVESESKGDFKLTCHSHQAPQPEASVQYPFSGLILNDFFY